MSLWIQVNTSQHYKNKRKTKLVIDLESPLYRWLGQHHGEERRVTFKTEEKQEKEPTKEVKDGMETLVENLLEPKISLDETKEYER